MCKVNTKWIVRNIERMKYKLKLLGRTVQMIITNSKLQNSTNSDYLPGRLFIAIQGNIVSIVDFTKIIIRRLGKQIAIELVYNDKKIIIISLYRIPQASSKGVYYTLTQYKKMDREAKLTSAYQHEIINKIQAYVKTNDTINDIIVLSDFN